ncbi:MAG: hypothetical protein HKO81_06200 [Flavobacteriaceae bacterium]|nr:hypothetical protein [Flavobacteriaceae bacterium]
MTADSHAQNLELELQGSNASETSTLDSLMVHPRFQDFSSLQTEIDSTLIKLQKTGYIESELLKLNKKNDSAFIAYFNLGKKYDNLYIYYSNNDISKDLLKKISTNVTDDFFAIPISKSENALKFLNSELANDGLPFVTFKIENISKRNDSELQGNLVINTTAKRKVNSIIVKGYEGFPRSFLKHYLNIRKDQSFNLNEIKSKTKILNSLPFAKQIKDPEVLFTKDSTSLYLYLEKSKSNTFDGFLGFGNNESTNKLEFDGYLNLKLNNNLNYGESFNLLYKSDENEQRTFDVNANLPYLFNSPLGVNLNLNIFRKDSTFTIVNQTAKLFYQLNRTIKISGGIELTSSENLLNQEQQSSQVQDYDASFFTASFEYLDRTSDFLFPIQSYFLVESGLGKRNYNNFDQDQTTIKFRTNKIFNLNNRNSIYINVNGDIIFSDSFLFNELRRFGGINSIRGFEENSLYASLYSVLNTEYRYSINQSIYVHSIIDGAYYEDDINEIKEKLFGFGFGLGLMTKAGLFKLNYANGLVEDQPFKFSNSKIHISLNAYF